MTPPAADPSTSFNMRTRLGKLLDVGIVLGLACTWVGCLAPWHWFPALFDHFRIQGSLACCVALMVAVLLRRRPWLVGLAAVSLVVNAWPLWQTSHPLSSSVKSDGHTSLKIIAFNVYTKNTRYPETLAYLQASNADVILLYEVNDAWAKALEPLHQTHPHGTPEVVGDNLGISLFSRLPLTDYQVTRMVEHGMPNILATVHCGDRVIRLVGTHPLPPTSAQTLHTLHSQMEAIAHWISAAPEESAIVLGDFNATPWSPCIQLLRETAGMDFRTSKPVWRPTWQVSSVLALPIDHALCTADLFFEQRELGPDLGSDHRSQELIVKWTQAAPAL